MRLSRSTGGSSITSESNSSWSWSSSWSWWLSRRWMVLSAARPWPSSSASGSLPSVAPTIFTSGGSSSRTSASTCARAAASMRSVLLSTTRSAAESWSSNSSCSGDSWSRLGSARRCTSTCAGFAANWPDAAAGPSTTVTTESTVKMFAMSGHWKACTSGLGSARPEVSMSTASIWSRRSASCSITGRNSSCTVQQTQPLASSYSAPSRSLPSSSQPMPQPRRMSPSMPSSPNSLTTTAMRRPSALPRMWRSSVVLPLPRKPVTMVTGILALLCVMEWMLSGAQGARGIGRAARAWRTRRRTARPLQRGAAGANQTALYRRRSTRAVPCRRRQALAAASTPRSTSGSTSTTVM
ncbi:hypothetical protein D9M72_465570 [compost metagenome]